MARRGAARHGTASRVVLSSIELVITLLTDSSVVAVTLLKGTGLTLRSSAILQTLYCTMLFYLIKAGHALLVRWIPS
jgi:hypothetical protein